jgi:hypothetical protein
MAYESRNGRTYYYKKERQGKKVVSVYCGNGERAELWADITALGIEERQFEASQCAAERASFAELARTPPALVELLAEAKRQTAAALQAAGYHQHKRGEWRKKRGSNKDESPSASGGAAE